MVHLGLCFFILHLRSRSYGTPISTYHFCNLKLTFLRYELFHTSCVNLWQICHTFHFYHNIFFFLTTCMSFSITNIFWYIYFFFVTAWQERELKMSNLPLSPSLEREHFLLSCWVCWVPPTSILDIALIFLHGEGVKVSARRQGK